MLRSPWFRPLLVASLFIQAAFAAPLEDRGDRLYDPGSGLEWLKLTFTAGRSYDDVAGGWGGLTRSGGYRFATGDEIRALFTHLGANATDPVSNLQAGKDALRLLGTAEALPSSDLYRSWMIYDPASEPPTPPTTHVPVSVFGYGITKGDQSVPDGFFLTPGLFSTHDYGSPEISSALVRAVPEPRIWMLLSGGIALLLWSRKQE